MDIQQPATLAESRKAPIMVGSGDLLGRMSEREKTLLNECCKYAIGDIGKKYIRFGGHGCAPIRYHHATLYNLRSAGLVEYVGYWKATQKGQDLMQANANLTHG